MDEVLWVVYKNYGLSAVHFLVKHYPFEGRGVGGATNSKPKDILWAPVSHLWPGI
jgi:hypothetical protein